MIACGVVTEVKSGPAFQITPGSSLQAVMCRQGERAQDYAARHGVPNWYDDAQALVDDPLVDAIYIATPPDAHLEYTRMAARAGKPVYVEKPLARTAQEGEAMLEACRLAGVPLFVAYYRRELPRFLKIKQLLDSGAIGRVRYTHTILSQPLPAAPDPENLPWRLRHEVSAGGVFVDMSCHLLDLLDFFFGPIASAAGFAASQTGLYQVEDAVSAAWQHQNGLLSTGLWCYSLTEVRDVTEIVGTQGSIRFPIFSEDPIELVTPSGAEQFRIPNPLHVQQPLIHTVVADLSGASRCPSTGESALRTTRVIDRILAQYRQQIATASNQEGKR
jgi:predicted dehydrogenase